MGKRNPRSFHLESCGGFCASDSALKRPVSLLRLLAAAAADGHGLPVGHGEAARRHGRHLMKVHKKALVAAHEMAAMRLAENICGLGGDQMLLAAGTDYQRLFKAAFKVKHIFCRDGMGNTLDSVSYTHLTLPTIYSV